MMDPFDILSGLTSGDDDVKRTAGAQVYAKTISDLHRAFRAEGMSEDTTAKYVAATLAAAPHERMVTLTAALHGMQS